MLFKTTDLQRELMVVHPRLRRKLYELDAWLLQQDYPRLVVTALLRKPEFYNPPKWSWHCAGCAFDIRSHHYTSEQKLAVLAWLARNCPEAEWDCLLEHEGQPNEHFHAEIEIEGLRGAIKQLDGTLEDPRGPSVA